jgi:hypothetical protein
VRSGHIKALDQTNRPVSGSFPPISRTRERPTLLRLVRSDLTLRCLSWQEHLGLGALCLCALILFAALQHGRVFLGDEIGTLKYLKESSTYILTHFGSWLTMNYFILAEKGVARLCGAMDWRLSLLPMAAAIAIIPLTASVALKFTGSIRTALIAASLAAFNPYLVMWAPMIRAYSLLVALSLLTIIEFFRWYEQRDWWSGIRCAATVLLLLLAHLNGIYIVAFLILLLLAESVSAGFSGGGKFLWQSKTLWIPLAGVAIMLAVAYWRLLPGIVKSNSEWATITPPTSMDYLPSVFTMYMGVSYAGGLSAFLLLAGCWSAIREKRALLLLCTAIFLAPIVMSLQGASVKTSAYARYLIFSLPLLLILMAEGIDWLARFVRIQRIATIAAWGLATILVMCWKPYIDMEFLIKKQWPLAEIAKFLHGEMQEHDVIVAGWSIGFTLGQFFDHPDSYIMTPDKFVSQVADRLDAPLQGRVFYLTGAGDGTAGRKPLIRRFGREEVTIYSGATARALLQEWREDLLRRTGGRVYAPLETDYHLLALLDERLSPGQSADHWRALAEQCRAQNPWWRDVPRRLQNAARGVLFP